MWVFLIGQGRAAGDPDAKPQTVDQVVVLLSRPIPYADELSTTFARLLVHPKPQPIPAPDTPAEADRLDVLTAPFIEPKQAHRASDAVQAAVGDSHYEILLAYLAFIRTAHYWTETHPKLTFEPDLLKVMTKHPDLANRLLDPTDAHRASIRRDAQALFAELRRTERALQDSEERLH